MCFCRLASERHAESTELHTGFIDHAKPQSSIDCRARVGASMGHYVVFNDFTASSSSASETAFFEDDIKVLSSELHSLGQLSIVPNGGPKTSTTGTKVYGLHRSRCILPHESSSPCRHILIFDLVRIRGLFVRSIRPRASTSSEPPFSFAGPKRRGYRSLDCATSRPSPAASTSTALDFRRRSLYLFGVIAGSMSGRESHECELRSSRIYC